MANTVKIKAPPPIIKTTMWISIQTDKIRDEINKNNQ
jgi:hypothetical protein